MTKCVFCGQEAYDFTGVHLIKNNGTVDFYCSSKCRKNSLKLGRDKRRIKWTEAYRMELAKEASDALRLKDREKKYAEDQKIEDKKKADRKVARKEFKANRDAKK